MSLGETREGLVRGRGRLLAGVWLLAGLAVGPAACRPADWQLEFPGDVWRVEGFANDLDLSGIAAAGNACLVGSDEEHHVQPGTIDRAARRIVPAERVALPVVGGRKKPEVDIEGIAYAPAEEVYYVTGSHGVGKKKGDFQPDRHAVYRIPRGAGSGSIHAAGIRRASLLPWLERTPELAGHLRQPLQRNGLNIEGLAESSGRLFFGLRAPNKNGRALVVEVGARELFSGAPGALTVHDLPMPRGRGLREIVAVDGGFVLLCGNASAEASKKFPVTEAPGPDGRFELHFWPGPGAAPERLGALPANGGKAEGLLVLEQTPLQIEMLVLFDSLPGGGPLTVRIRRGIR